MQRLFITLPFIVIIVLFSICLNRNNTENIEGFNDDLEIISTGQFKGPENFTFDNQGNIYFGCENGSIVKCKSDFSDMHEWYNTGGRPLGMIFDKHGNLYICDAEKGLICIDHKKEMKKLNNDIKGEKPFFTDDLTLSSNGLLFYTEPSSCFKHGDTMAWFSLSGRVLVYNTILDSGYVLVDSLAFPNGIVLSKNENELYIGLSKSKEIIRACTFTGSINTCTTINGIPDCISYNVDSTSIIISFYRSNIIFVDKNWLTIDSLIIKEVFPNLTSMKLINGNYLVGNSSEHHFGFFKFINL